MKVKLGDICSFQSGGTPSRKRKEYFNGDIPWITTVALNGKTVDENDAVEMISDVAIRESAAKIVPQKSIMIGTRVGVGKVAMNMVPMATNQDIISAVGIDEQQWDKEYIVKLISSKQELLKSESRGATIKGIKLDILKKIEIPNIPIEKQRAISLIFNRLDKTIERQEQQKYLLDQLVKSRFIEMFGDPVSNNFNWKQMILREVTSKIGSGATPRGGKESYQAEGITLIRSMNVYDRRFEYKDLAHITSEQAAQLNNVIVEEGDVFINITGASVARSCIVPSNILPARVNQHVAIVRCNHSRLQPVFVNNMFLNEHFKEELLDIGESGGATRQAITKQQLENLVVILPPLALQNQFADFVAQVDKSKFACALTMHFYQTLQNSLRQEWMRCQTLNF